MSPVRIAGLFLTAISGLTIVYNVAQMNYNQQVFERIRSQKANIDDASLAAEALSGGIAPAFSFTPPFTGFEILVLVACAAGVLMTIAGRKKPA
jgi:hypothetical protein